MAALTSMATSTGAASPTVVQRGEGLGHGEQHLSPGSDMRKPEQQLYARDCRGGGRRSYAQDVPARPGCMDEGCRRCSCCSSAPEIAGEHAGVVLHRRHVVPARAPWYASVDLTDGRWSPI